MSQNTGLEYEDSLNVTVAVTNNGPYDGQEVVQVYLTDLVSSVVTSNQFLAGCRPSAPLPNPSPVRTLRAALSFRIWLQFACTCSPPAIPIP